MVAFVGTNWLPNSPASVVANRVTAYGTGGPITAVGTACGTLPHRLSIRDHLVHQERSRIDHASRAARRTKAAALAGKGNHFVVPTVLAPEPGNAMSQDATTQEPIDLAPAKPRDVTFSLG